MSLPVGLHSLLLVGQPVYPAGSGSQLMRGGDLPAEVLRALRGDGSGLGEVKGYGFKLR